MFPDGEFLPFAHCSNPDLGMLKNASSLGNSECLWQEFIGKDVGHNRIFY